MLGERHMMRVVGLASVIWAAIFANQALAQDVRITEHQANATVSVNGQTITISRIQDHGHRLTGDFARTSRACPPACVQPMIAARGVATAGELEVLGFLKGPVSLSRGLLIDARMPDDFSRGSLPAAVNVPTATVAPENPYRADILRALGAVEGDRGDLDFTNALDLMLFSNGPWDPAATLMVQHLRESGYPADKINFYRAGLQGWLSLGLSVSAVQNQG